MWLHDAGDCFLKSLSSYIVVYAQYKNCRYPRRELQELSWDWIFLTRMF